MWATVNKMKKTLYLESNVAKAEDAADPRLGGQDYSIVDRGMVSTIPRLSKRQPYQDRCLISDVGHRKSASGP